jgi:hypothetical protein
LQELSLSGVMTLAFAETPAGTRLDMTYRVGGYAKDGLAGFASPVDMVLAEQVARVKRFVETGTP